MTVTDKPWDSLATSGADLRLVRVPAPVLRALADGDTGQAVRLSATQLTPYLLGDECRGLWQMRSAQVIADPDASSWITRIIEARGEVPASVGLAGFHGPPDHRGMVEIGYRIDPALRRRGFARAAFEILLATASNAQSVEVIRATVSPGNVASQALIGQYGFVEVGEQWDDEDGLEIIFERPCAPPLAPERGTASRA